MAFLNEAYAGDEALRGEIISLLDSNDLVGSFIESPPHQRYPRS